MRKRKILSFIIIFTMIISSLSVGYGSTDGFSDMPDNWSTEALENAFNNGLLKGDDGKIMPEDNLTRAQMATVINRAFGAEGKVSIENYTDVSPEAWYFDEMAKAVQMKTFQGSGNNLNPEDAITREQAFIVMARALKLEKSNEEPEGFSDLDNISSWAKEEVFSMIKAGYVKGSNGKINPKATITRAEFAQLMDNLIKLYISEEGEYTEVVEGNIMINVPDVTLKDIKVTGDLIIGDGVGDGDVVLDNVEVTGRLLVRGGGEDTIIIKGDSNIQNIVIARVDGVVRVYNQSGKEISEVIVDGSDDVVLEGMFGHIELLADDVDVYALRAAFSDSNIIGNNSRIILPEEGGSDRKSVQSVSIEGDTDFIGSTISAVTVPSASTVNYKWLISDTSDGEFIEIEGEVSSTYEITSDDIGKFIKVEVKGTGDYFRTRTSDAVLMGFGGTDADTGAYKIANWYHLDNIRYVLDGDFVMTANLGAPEEVVPAGVVEEVYETKGYDEVVGNIGFEPIGQPILIGSISTFAEENEILSQLFTGSFDGNNHTIKDLYVDKQMQETRAMVEDMSNTAGLFGIIYRAEIQNLTIKNSGISGNTYVGALAGYSRESTISNVHNSSDFNMIRSKAPQGVVFGYTRVGGIVGFNDSSTINNSSNDSFVLGEEYVGGIAGSNHVDNYNTLPSVMVVEEPDFFESYITDSWNEGQIIGYRYIGGITGSNGSEYYDASLNEVQDLVSYPEIPAYISRCYNSGVIVPITRMFDYIEPYSMRIGGIVGYNSGTISESYNDGMVGEEMIMNLSFENVEITGAAYEATEVGGIAGSSYFGKILNSYNKGSIYGEIEVGGIVGSTYYSEIKNNYNVGDLYRLNIFDKTLAIVYEQTIYGDENSTNFEGNYFLDQEEREMIEVKAPYIYGIYGRTIEELRNPLTYENEVYSKAIVDEYNWDFENIWFMNLSTNNGLPILRWEEEMFETEPSLNVTMPAFTLTYGENTSQAAVTTGGMVEAYGQPLDGEFAVVDSIDGLAPGTYDIKTSFNASGDSDFLTFYGYSELVVEKADLTITAFDTMKVYGDTQIFDGTEFSTSGLVYSDTVSSIDLSSNGATTEAAVGTYNIVASNALGNSIDYYNITYVDGTLTVNPREIEVTAATDTKTYDGDTDSVGLPTLTAGSLVVGHTGDWIQSFDNKNVGIEKTITPTGTVVRDSDNTDVTDNYNINFVTTTGSITAVDLTLSNFNADDKTYDGSVIATGSFDDDRVTGDEVTFDYTAEFADKNVGTGKTVTFTGINISGGSDQNNYNLVTTTGSALANITVKDLSITADDKTKTYDGNTYSSFTASYDGFVVGEDENDLVGSLDFTGSAISAVDVGTYMITPYGLSSTNYDITFVDGTLTITEAVPTENLDFEKEVHTE